MGSARKRIMLAEVRSRVGDKRDKKKGDTDITDKQTDGHCEQSAALKCKIHKQ